MKNIAKILSIIFFLPLLASKAQKPYIDSILPTHGNAGSLIRIKGGNFSTTSLGNTVYTGAAKAKIVTASDTIIIALAPVNATYEPITVTSNNLTAWSNIPFIVTFPGAQNSFDETSFSTHQDSYIGLYSFPEKNCLADFNLDGKTDIAVTNLGRNSFSVFENISSPGILKLDEPKEFYGLFAPLGVTTSDIDGDGKLDLIFCNNNATFSIYQNTSTINEISFKQVNFNFGVYFGYGIAAGDIDEDGKPDLIIAGGYLKNVIYVFRNTGSSNNISFADKIAFEIANDMPECIAVVDVDKDKKKDLVIANGYEHNTISILKNLSANNDINFGNRIDLESGNGARNLAIGDLDQDGKIDIAVANINQNTVSVFRNLSTFNTILFDTKKELETDNDPEYVSINDLDGDGNPDLAVGCAVKSSDIVVFKNISLSGSIAFQEKVAYKTPDAPNFISIGDLDNDGKPDIIASCTDYGGISILSNTIQGTLPFTLTNFTASTSCNTANLTWQTATETKNNGFYIEQSTDGINYKQIGFVAGKVNGTTVQNYLYTVNSLVKGNYYFRLQQVDKDGRSTYSKTMMANINCNNNKITLSPNPVKSLVYINGLPATGISNIKIVNASGIVVKNAPYLNGQPLNVALLPSGFYLLLINNTTTLKFIKQ